MMNETVTIQVVISFLTGGCFITLLTLVAERVDESIAGIIMMFPSTIVLGFFFLGLTTSAEKVALIIPSTLIPLGIIIFSSVVYIYCAILFSKFLRSKTWQVVATFATSSVVWFVLAAPFAIWKFSNLTIGILGFFALVIICDQLYRCNKSIAQISHPEYSAWQITIRAFLIGSVIATVVLLGKVSNPFWGGIFTMFPAATFSGLMILHFHYQPKQLFYFFREAPIGSLSLFTYVISVMFLFPKYGIIAGSITSYFFSLTIAIIFIRYKLVYKK